MGWNSWNRFHCEVSEDLIRAQAEALVASGLRDAGYTFLNVDDCWMAEERNADGDLEAHPERFPSGIRHLSDYVHSLGLKFGLYSSAGHLTCAGFPAGMGHEARDAARYAEWGVDYLKYDNCHSGGVPPQERFAAMSEALNATGRPIVFSMCEWGVDGPWEGWAAPLANVWRTTPDIRPAWDSVSEIVDRNEPLYAAAGPGAFNDPDMLEVGNPGLTDTEARAHFSLWAMMKAPLLAGCDLANLTAAARSILGNAEVIAVNQDALGVQGRVVKRQNHPDFGALEVWAAPLEDGDLAVLLFNRDDDLQGPKRTIEVLWEDIGLPGGAPAAVRDLWEQADMGAHPNGYRSEVPAHGVAMLRVQAEACNEVESEACNAVKHHINHHFKLRPAQELAVTVPGGAPGSGTWGEVALHRCRWAGRRRCERRRSRECALAGEAANAAAPGRGGYGRRRVRGLRGSEVAVCGPYPGRRLSVGEARQSRAAPAGGAVLFERRLLCV
jgi:alpha-galactosidase